MSTRTSSISSSISLSGALAAILLLTTVPAPGQRGRAVPTGPAPKTADGKPDLSGVWNTDRPFVVDITGALKKGETLPTKPETVSRMKEQLSKDDPEAQCLPTGVPRLAPIR